jgi:hypothetical protein
MANLSTTVSKKKMIHHSIEEEDDIGRRKAFLLIKPLIKPSKMKCSSTARTDRKKERKQTDLQKHSM